MTSTDRDRLRDQARDAFLRAAAALTTDTATDTLAFALLEGATGLRAVAELDHHRTAQAVVTDRLNAVRSGR